MPTRSVQTICNYLIEGQSAQKRRDNGISELIAQQYYLRNNIIENLSYTICIRLIF